MRRLILCLAALCMAAALAALGLRLSRAEQAARTQADAHFAAACEALDVLSADLDKAALTAPGDLQASLLLNIARSGNTARTHLAALPLSQDAAAAVASALNGLTDQADALLCTLAAGHAPDAAAVDALLHRQALCRRLCAQLAISREAGVSDGAAPALSQQLQQAVCCDGEHDAPVPIRTLPAPRGLPAQTVSPQEALTLAAAYVGGDALRTEAAPDTDGPLPAYGAAVYTDDLRINLEITRQGGKLLWMAPENAAFPQLCTREDARAAIADYLLLHGFGPMEEVAWQLYDGLYTAAMAPVQDQVILYPDVLHIQVRTDTARVVGFEAAAYWTNHVQRSLPEPRLTVHEAAALLPAGLPHSGLSLCLLPAAQGETLCYQAHVRYGEDDYLLFFSAENGQQLAVHRLIRSGSGSYPDA